MDPRNPILNLFDAIDLKFLHPPLVHGPSYAGDSLLLLLLLLLLLRVMNIENMDPAM
jgi:hypothetical protein